MENFEIEIARYELQRVISTVIVKADNYNKARDIIQNRIRNKEDLRDAFDRTEDSDIDLTQEHLDFISQGKNIISIYN